MKVTTGIHDCCKFLWKIFWNGNFSLGIWGESSTAEIYQETCTTGATWHQDHRCISSNYYTYLYKAMDMKPGIA